MSKIWVSPNLELPCPLPMGFHGTHLFITVQAHQSVHQLEVPESLGVQSIFSGFIM